MRFFPFPLLGLIVLFELFLTAHTLKSCREKAEKHFQEIQKPNPADDKEIFPNPAEGFARALYAVDYVQNQSTDKQRGTHQQPRNVHYGNFR